LRDWTLARFHLVAEVTRADGLAALRLMRDAGGTGGHEIAIDALQAALAARPPGPVIVYTSGPGDWKRLLGTRVALVKV
jgi:hypothetical protein